MDDKKIEEKKSEEKGQYIGPRKILSTVKTEMATPQGGEILHIIYEGGYNETMPKKTFDLLVLSEATDWNFLQKRKFLPIVQDLLDVIMEYDIKATELDALLQSVGREVDNAFNRAVNFLWTGEDSFFIPGANPMMDRTLLSAVEVTNKIPKKEEKIVQPKTDDDNGKTEQKK